MIPSFKKLANSDDSDMSDDDRSKPIAILDPQFDEKQSETTGKEAPLFDSVKSSDKLNIIDQTRKNKFSVWRDVLFEQELGDLMQDSLKLKKRLPKKKNQKTQANTDKMNMKSTKKSIKFKKEEARKLNDDIVVEIGKKLKETRLDIIKKIVQEIGDEKAKRLTSEVLQIESSGGLMTSDNVRRRSPGGVLFFLVKNDTSLSDEQKRNIFCDQLVKQNNFIRKKTRRVLGKVKTVHQKRKGNTNPKKKKKNKKNKKK